MAITQTITALPPVPDPSMSEEDFEANAAEFTDALPPLVAEINALIPQINSTASDINTKHSQVTQAASEMAQDEAALAAAVQSAQQAANSASSSASSAASSKDAAAQSATSAASSATQLAAAINSIGQTTGTGLGKTKINVLSGQIIRDLGTVAGNLDFANMTRDAGITAEAYLHLNMGITPAASKMTYYKIHGVDFESLLLHEERCFAYVAYGGIYSQKATQNGLNPYFYIGANGYAYLRLKLTRQYYNSIFIDGMILYNGTADELVFTSGRITALTVSTI